MKNIISALMILSFISCKENKDTDEISTGTMYINDFNNDEKINLLTDRIIVKGDTTAYNELQKIYFLSNHTKDLLYYALVMAEDYKYPKAYFSAFIILRTNDQTKNIKTNQLANYYLLKASELGYRDTRYHLEDRLKSNINLSSNEYFKKIVNTTK